MKFLDLIFGRKKVAPEVPPARPRKTYTLDLIPEDITLIGSGTFLYSARAKAKDGEVVEVIVRLKDAP